MRIERLPNQQARLLTDQGKPASAPMPAAAAYRQLNALRRQRLKLQQGSQSAGNTDATASRGS